VTVDVRFYGHACFGLFVEGGESICVDPYQPGALNGAVDLEPIGDEFDYVVCSHGHVDHAATTAIAASDIIQATIETPGFSIRRHTVFHDEFGGRLRGGTTDILTIDLGGRRIVHLGDLGERLTSKQIANWSPGSIDLLIAPVGGYFTLGADGAFELVEKLQPSFVIPCHAAGQGVTLPELVDCSHFMRRFSTDAIIAKDQSHWSLPTGDMDDTPPKVARLKASRLASHHDVPN
jgi:L-ascorbate metabolism protein UlaG (beta-lactamase superfamily)